MRPMVTSQPRVVTSQPPEVTSQATRCTEGGGVTDSERLRRLRWSRGALVVPHAVGQYRTLLRLVVLYAGGQDWTLHGLIGWVTCDAEEALMSERSQRAPARIARS
eukprot:3284695-Rhodomonas_salina.1